MTVSHRKLHHRQNARPTSQAEERNQTVRQLRRQRRLGQQISTKFSISIVTHSSKRILLREKSADCDRTGGKLTTTTLVSRNITQENVEELRSRATNQRIVLVVSRNRNSSHDDALVRSDGSEGHDLTSY
jgi:hypothetical protein